MSVKVLSWLAAAAGAVCLMVWLSWNNLHYWPLLWLGVILLAVSVQLEK